jgi:rRNA maturation endonuclease Nob1
MKIVHTQRGIIIEAFDNKPATYDAYVTYDKVVRPFEENKLRVLDSAFMIEGNLDTIISYYFFGRNIPETKEKSEKFKTFILSSDWCSFSAKRKLIIHIINEMNLLKGAEKNDYESLLRKTMSYRNAFAHEVMSTNGEIAKLKFYEGGTKIKTIDDNYLNEIEKDLNLAFEMTMKIAIQIGAIVPHNENGEIL